MELQYVKLAHIWLITFFGSFIWINLAVAKDNGLSAPIQSDLEDAELIPEPYSRLEALDGEKAYLRTLSDSREKANPLSGDFPNSFIITLQNEGQIFSQASAPKDTDYEDLRDNEIADLDSILSKLFIDSANEWIGLNDFINASRLIFVNAHQLDENWSFEFFVEDLSFKERQWILKDEHVQLWLIQVSTIHQEIHLRKIDTKKLSVSEAGYLFQPKILGNYYLEFLEYHDLPADQY